MDFCLKKNDILLFPSIFFFESVKLKANTDFIIKMFFTLSLK